MDAEVVQIRGYLSEIDCFHEVYESLIVQLVELRRARDEAWGAS